tara:strand:- start:110 stop:547 length:438 start_codon:yes stop_codon:yes gene_type:complete
MTDNTAKISELVVRLKDKIGLTKISATTIHIVLKEAMELVEEFKIPGSEKKDNVIKIVKTLVNDLVEEGAEKDLINSMIENQLLENTIDLVVSATRGKLNLNNKKTRNKLILVFGTVLETVVKIVTICTRKSSTNVESVNVQITK